MPLSADHFIWSKAAIDNQYLQLSKSHYLGYTKLYGVSNMNS